MICGHIHHPALRELLGIRYVNTGDWVESCTAIVEHYDGCLELIRWTDLVTANPGSSEVEVIAAASREAA